MGCSPGATGSMHSVHPAFDSSDLQIRPQPQHTLPSPQFVHNFYHDFARLLCPPLPGRFSAPSPFDEHAIMMQSVPEAVLDHCISSSGPTVACSLSSGTIEFHRPFAHIFLCHQAALCNSRIEHLGLGIKGSGQQCGFAQIDATVQHVKVTGQVAAGCGSPSGASRGLPYLPNHHVSAK